MICTNPSELSKSALELLATIYRDGIKYKKCGVYLAELGNTSCQQLDLFQSNAVSECEKLSKTLDAINAKYGASMIRPGRVSKDNSWDMNQNHLSPCYTSRWGDLRECKSNCVSAI